MMYEHEMDSPLGRLRICGDDRAVTAIHLPGEGEIAPLSGTPGGHLPHLREAVAQLIAYFAGELRQFELPTAAQGTPHEQAVWKALCTIPYGAIESYGGLARTIGRPGAARAVGRANSRNPLAIVVPCHRVIGANGTLTGYAGGLDAKRWLLAHEARFARGEQDVRQGVML